MKRNTDLEEAKRAYKIRREVRQANRLNERSERAFERWRIKPVFIDKWKATENMTVRDTFTSACARLFLLLCLFAFFGKMFGGEDWTVVQKINVLNTLEPINWQGDSFLDNLLNKLPSNIAKLLDVLFFH